MSDTTTCPVAPVDKPPHTRTSPIVTALSMLFAAVLPPVTSGRVAVSMSAERRTATRCVGSFAAVHHQLRPVDRDDVVPAEAVEGIDWQQPKKIHKVMGTVPERLPKVVFAEVLLDNSRPLQASRAPYQALLGNADRVGSQHEVNVLLWGLSLQSGPRSALSPLALLLSLRGNTDVSSVTIREALVVVAATTPVASLTAVGGAALWVQHPAPALLLTHVVGRWVMQHVHDADAQGDLTQTAIQLICQRGVNVAPSTFLHAHDTSVDSLRGLVSSGLPVASALTQCPQLVRLLTSGATSDTVGDAATVRRCVDNIIRVLEYLCSVYDGAGTPPVFLQRHGKEWPLLAAAGAWTPIADATVPWILARSGETHTSIDQNATGLPPLTAACANGSFLAAQALFRHGLQGGRRSDSSMQNCLDALLLAAHRHHLDVVRLLLENGTPVDRPGTCRPRGATALTMACHGKSHESAAIDSSRRRAVVELLLRHGANPFGPELTFTGEQILADANMPLMALARHDDVATFDVLLPAWEVIAGSLRELAPRAVQCAQMDGWSFSAWERAIDILASAAAVALEAGNDAMSEHLDSAVERLSREHLR
jgi:hypothetical protein